MCCVANFPEFLQTELDTNPTTNRIGSTVAESEYSGEEGEVGGGKRRERSREVEADENAPLLEGKGNAWLQQMLQQQQLEDWEERKRQRLGENGEEEDEDSVWSSVNLFSDDLFSDDGPTKTLSVDDNEFEVPPPPVIPFIKYASPGPPKSPWSSPDCTQPEFRILSLDGGGVRGVLTAVILGRILKEVPSFLDNVDLIAGTSTGGLMGLMLAAGYTPEECEDIYKYACPLIFSKDPWRVYNPLKAKYSPDGRSEICKAYLNEDRTLRDLKKHVVITSFKLDGKVGQMGAFISMNGGWRPAVFSNIPKLDGKLEPDLDLQAWDAAMRTSAAPTYFPSHKGYVDGAMFANNPSMLAVSKACAHFPKVTPENTVVLSVGVGNFPISIPTPEDEDLDWGVKDWVPYIFDLLLDGDSLSSELLLRYMLNSPSKNQNIPENRYHRIDATLPRYMELDDVSAIPLLVEIGNKLDLNDTIAFVRTHFSSTPTASDAFAQAAVKTASWARETALKVQLNEVIGSLTAMPNIDFASGWSTIPNITVPDISDIANINIWGGEEEDATGPSSPGGSGRAGSGAGDLSGGGAQAGKTPRGGVEEGESGKSKSMGKNEALGDVSAVTPKDADGDKFSSGSRDKVLDSLLQDHLNNDGGGKVVNELTSAFGAAAKASALPNRKPRGEGDKRGGSGGKEEVTSFRRVWDDVFEKKETR